MKSLVFMLLYYNNKFLIANLTLLFYIKNLDKSKSFTFKNIFNK
jgi:hypothetical protein